MILGATAWLSDKITENLEAATKNSASNRLAISADSPTDAEKRREDDDIFFSGSDSFTKTPIWLVSASTNHFSRSQSNSVKKSISFLPIRSSSSTHLRIYASYKHHHILKKLSWAGCRSLCFQFVAVFGQLPLYNIFLHSRPPPHD